MKAQTFYLIIIATILALDCRDMGQPFDDDVVNQVGTIVQAGSESCVIKTDAPVPTKWGTFDTFVPLNLLDSLKRDGYRIRFGGKIDDRICSFYPALRLSWVQTISQ